MKSKRNFIIIFLIGVLFYVMISLYISYCVLTVHTYNFQSDKVKDEIKFVILSDLHDHEFGLGNEELIVKTRELSPDLILILGDMLNNNSENVKVSCELVKKLTQIAPVYYALGNHEISYMEQHSDLVWMLEQSGAVVLDKEFVDLNIAGTEIRLGGLYDYAFGLNGENKAEVTPNNVKHFLEEFQETEYLKIMMSHRPDSFIFGNASEYWDIDLVLSGHNHGGQVVLPFAGGVYGGDQGYFPEYVHGLYEKDGMNIFVTSGLSSNQKILPRFNNPPEIAVIICSENDYR
ncbi:MAG: metallophosphoesterase [Schaedlerella sp.]|nr:metallophosphoesterase [Schaedlerella sp.]